MSEIRVTQAGSYAEAEGDSVRVTQLGNYAEAEGTSIRATQLGAYAEIARNELRVTQAGFYAELAAELATTTPVLAGTTLPEPFYENGYRETVLYRGGSLKMADGTVVFDLVQSSAKREFRLTWRLLTSAQKTTVQTAFEAIKSSYSTNNFTAPTGTVYTVTRHPAQGELQWETALSGGNLRFSTTMRLREV